MKKNSKKEADRKVAIEYLCERDFDFINEGQWSRTRAIGQHIKRWVQRLWQLL